MSQKICVVESLFQGFEVLQRLIINITEHINKTMIIKYYLYKIKAV